MLPIGNDNVPKIIISNTLNLFLKLQSAFWIFQTITVSESCLINRFRIFFEKYDYILALEIDCPGNQQCANCIGTLSFPIVV